MKFIATVLFFFLAVVAFAQQPVLDSVNRQRELINRKGMLVLGSWAVLNLGSGIIGQRQTAGEQKHFHRMNTIWGGVNLLLAGVSFFSSKRGAADSQRETFRKQATAEKLFLFNTALDLGYVTMGLYTRERSNRFANEKRDRLRGTGKSLLVQGGFLAIFDGVIYLLHTKNGSRLRQSLSGLTFGQSANGVGILYHF